MGVKITFLCLNFNSGTANLQPRKYIYEVARRLSQQEPETTILTDGAQKSPYDNIFQGIRIRRIKKLGGLLRVATKETILEIQKLSPDLIVWSVGLTSFLRPKGFHDSRRSIIGVYTTPAYELRDILRLGVRELLSNFEYLATHIVGLLVPSILVRKTLNSRTFVKIIVESRAALRKLVKMGVRRDKIVVIPPGVSKHDLLATNPGLQGPLEEAGRIFRITYLGSSLTLRGTDIAVEAFSRIKDAIPNSRLLLQLRVDKGAYGSLKKQEEYLKEMCQRRGLLGSVVIDSSDINEDQVRACIRSSDIVLLPFKIVLSDMPITALEVMALGVPIITTNVDGLPEMVEKGRGLVVQAVDPNQLAQAIYILYKNNHLAYAMGKRAKDYIQQHLSWEDVYSKVRDVLTIAQSKAVN